ncbi:MAG: hypothetical protein H6Q90_2884 [Deltaproteobacteria bacterium]|nr:hypothetical protein [Deltaproteobacteria bacterium]
MVALLVAFWRWRASSSDEAAPAVGAGSGSGSGAFTARGGKLSKPAEPASLSGRVTRLADGTGVAGAIVAVANAELGSKFMTRDQMSTTTATTDATGAWQVAAIAPGNYTISATASGFVPAARPKLAVAAGSRTVVDLALVAGGTVVTGLVSDVGGGPIGGARLTVQRDDTMFGSAPELIAITGADGRYQLSLADGSYTAEARHDDYTRVTRPLELTGKPLTIDFVLAPGGSIRGQVVSRDGRPVAGALVVAHGRRMQMMAPSPPVTADDTGSFTIRSLGSGAISLTASGRGFASRSPTVVELGIGEQVDGVTVVVDRAFTISGRAVRAGKPAEGIAGVRLGVFSMGSAKTAAALDPTDDTGAFEVFGVQPGSYMMFAIGEGVIPEIGKPVEVVDKDVTDLVIELAVGATLSGRIEPGTIATLGLELDSDKIGIANMFTAMKSMMVRADSDETGAFTMRSVPTGTYALVATTTDGRKGKLPVTVTAADQTGLVVKLEPRASFAGRVVDAGGAAVPGVRVVVRHPGESPGFFMPSMRDSGATTGADGAFREVGLEPGKISVSVADDQGPLAWARGDKRAEPLTYELAKAQEMTGVTLTVESRDGVIRGLVLGPDHKPAPDAWVTPHVEAKNNDPMDLMSEFLHPPQPVLTDADGRFAIVRLRRGTYELVVEAARGTSRAQQSGVKTGDSVTLTLEPLGTLSGTVTANGAVVTTYDLTCRAKELNLQRDPMTDLHRRIIAADGKYSLERLAPGEYVCTVTADAGTGDGSAKVTTGPVQLDLALASWASVTGVVVSSVTGQPVPGLHAITGGGFQFGDVLSGKGPTTDATGRFVVERVAAGKGRVMIVQLEATLGSPPLATREYTVTTGQRQDLGTIKILPPRTGEAGTLGISTEAAGTTITISSVKPGGPGELAGIAVGDHLVSIDGRPVTELGVDTARQLVASGSMSPGQRVELGIERGGKPVAIPIVATKW